jgi:hypothetical protein
MVSTRKTPSRKATLPLDSSSGLEALDDEVREDVVDTDRLSVSIPFHRHIYALIV